MTERITKESAQDMRKQATRLAGWRGLGRRSFAIIDDTGRSIVVSPKPFLRRKDDSMGVPGTSLDITIQDRRPYSQNGINSHPVTTVSIRGSEVTQRVGYLTKPDVSKGKPQQIPSIKVSERVGYLERRNPSDTAKYAARLMAKIEREIGNGNNPKIVERGKNSGKTRDEVHCKKHHRLIW